MYRRELIPDDVVLFEPRAMDVALLGYSEVDGVERACYSMDGLIRYFMEQFQDASDPEEAAVEWISFNVAGLKLTNDEGRFSHPVIVVDL